MPFDCPSLCFETTFLVALSRYNLTKGAHSSSENPLQSFVACFSTLLPGEDVANRASLLYRSITEGMDGANSYYASGIELEYGIHAHLLTEASCPNAALLSAFSRIFNMEIYVVCGNLPLRFLRIEGNNGEYDVVKFNFCRSESPRRVVIGLIGMGVYHLIKQPANDSHLWQALGRRAIIVNESVILTNDQPSDDEDENVRDVEDELASNMNNRLETDVSPEADQTDGQNPESVSVQSFISQFMSHDGNGSNLNSAAYTSPVKIDIGLTSREDLGGQQLSALEQVIDVDGFFGVYKWQSKSVFKGHVEILRNPIAANEREIKSCRKHLKDHHFRSQDKLILSKVAVCNTNFGIIDLFYAGFINIAESDCSDDDLYGMIKESYAYAKSAKCRDEETGEITHSGCQSIRFRDNTDAYRSISGANDVQIYDRHRYECFTYHFEQALLSRFANNSVRVTGQFCYAQVVGMKFVMLSPTINGLTESVSAIGEFFDLNKMHSSFDICFSTIGHCSDSEKKVRKKSLFMLILNFLDNVILEEKWNS